MDKSVRVSSWFRRDASMLLMTTLGLNEYSVVKAKPLVKVEWVHPAVLSFLVSRLRLYSLPNGADLLDVVGPLGHPGMV